MDTTEPATDLAARLASLEARLATLEARQATLEHARIPDLAGIVEQLFGAEALGHMRTARREDLLALRAILDTWLSRVEGARGQGASKPPPRRRESITLE